MGVRAADPEVGLSADVREAGVYDAYGLYVTRYPTSPHRSPLVSNNHRVPPRGPSGSGESGDRMRPSTAHRPRNGAAMTATPVCTTFLHHQPTATGPSYPRAHVTRTGLWEGRETKEVRLG